MIRSGSVNDDKKIGTTSFVASLLNRGTEHRDAGRHLEVDLGARRSAQVAEQPPPLGARMKASWNAFCPVAFMTATGSGGLLSNGIR